MSSLDNMHHIIPYPKSQFIKLSIIKKRFYISSYQCFHYLSCCNRFWTRRIYALRTIFVIYLLTSRHIVLFVIQSRVTGEVTSIARGVENGGSRQEEDIAFDISSDLWNNPAGEYAWSSFFYCYSIFFCCLWLSLFILLCKLNQEFSIAYFRSLEHPNIESNFSSLITRKMN